MSPLATWVGPFDALLPNMSTLRVGETYDVTERDLESAHWQAVTPPAAATPAAKLTPTVSKPAEEATD